MDYCMGIVDDLSFITMLEENKVLTLRPERLNLKNEISSILSKLRECDEFRLKLKTSCIDVSVDLSVPDNLMLDKSLLRAIYNLLSNAVRFSPPHMDIFIKLRYENTNNNSLDPNSLVREGTLSFQVSNSIDKMVDEIAINKAFQYYYHSDMSSDVSIAESLTSIQGLGLGLYVSYNIVSLLGGMLDFTISEKNISFQFSLPIRDEDVIMIPIENEVVPEETKNKWSSVFQVPGVENVLNQKVEDNVSTASIDNSDMSKRRILVVDDSPICQKVLRKILSAEYSVDLASNGLEALSILSVEPCIYDMVLMDLRMPMMDGITATR